MAQNMSETNPEKISQKFQTKFELWQKVEWSGVLKRTIGNKSERKMAAGEVYM